MVASASKLAVVIGFDLENGHDAAHDLDPAPVRPDGRELTPGDASAKRRSR